MRIILLSLLLSTPTLQALETPMCGTSPENDVRVRAVHERTRERGRVRSLATKTATLREGAFYVRNDADITPGYRPFDLEGKSLFYSPAGGLAEPAYLYQVSASRYVEPAGPMLHDFQADPGTHYITHELPFLFRFADVNRSRIYVTAYNGIAFDPPVVETGTQFDAIETAVHRAPILSPLMTTARKPRFLESPKVWIDSNPDLVRVTWRSTGNAPFGYDVQAELGKNGTITFSYKSVTGMRWGTPAILTGFDPESVSRAPIVGVDDSQNDVNVPQVPAALQPMLNIKRVEVERLRNGDLFAIRIQLMQPIDRSKLSDTDAVGFQATIGVETAAIEISKSATMVASFTGATYEADGASARVDGDVIEIYGIQPDPERASERSLRVLTLHRPSNRVTDTATVGIPFPAAPRTTSNDLSAFPSGAMMVPIAETFTLGAFDPFEVWNIMRTSHAISDYEYDAVAMYQTHYTDMIFYAGAYATGGNPQVDGVAPYSPGYGRHASRGPTLLHMNQLTYNYSAAEHTAAKVMLHEFGHRWLYFFSIRENGQTGRYLNPISAHPAAYVHTPAAFPVYGPNESSVMGGAYFTQQPNGTYRAHVANYGFSWTDLYLMGLAAPEEVPSWFYIANTDLPKAYWPTQGQIADGQRRDVNLSQVTAVHGPRIPSVDLAQRRFRVLFVLVTEEGEPTTEEVAKLNQWRTVMERNFELATGGRGRLETTYVKAGKKRATR
ncbi:MAG TPA: hypothetical protein VEO54_18515 [Thermoanaerobaculia bacterium]|nr:hypothetical protein [Thermoanaerobaculia bacterium]